MAKSARVLRLPPRIRLGTIILVMMVFVPFVVESKISPADAGAMQDLLASLKGLDSLKWSQTTDPCTDWEKVTCSGDRVSAIQIGSQSLSGLLPSSISNLTSLTRLELQSNKISGKLPSLKGLSTLQVLLLHGNLFTFMPSDFFSGLTSMQVVSLDYNPFDPWELPLSLKDCSALVNFSANGVNLTGSVPEMLADAGSFPGLTHVNLAFNMLEGTLPPGFGLGSPITVLWLNGQNGKSGGLTGDISVVRNMTNLQQLWLHSNQFSGPLPDFSQLVGLWDLELRDNHLTGPVPTSLPAIKTLKNVTLTNNLLQGPVPEFAKDVHLDMDVATERFCLKVPGDCDPRVTALLSAVKEFGYPERFADSWKGNDPCANWAGIGCDAKGDIILITFKSMDLIGTISPDFSLFPALQRLLLSGNKISGTIPKVLTSLVNLKELDLSDNSLSGAVPAFTKNVKVVTSGNPDIGKDVSGLVTSSSTGSQTSGGSDAGTNDGRKHSMPIGVIVGSIMGCAAGVAFIIVGFFLYKKKNNPFNRVQTANTMVIHPRHSSSDRDLVKISIAALNGGGAGTSSEPISREASNLGDVHVVESGNMVISIQVLRSVTNNFSSDNILGQGGFGTVYKGELHDGTKIAVKRMESGAMGTKGLNEFQSEIAVLTKVRHRHLVSLLGYCLDGNERLLVYEYMPQGTLSRHLFNWKEEGLRPLEWKKRLSLALDVARGVEYLHSLAHQSFIHRDLKPSNILLGDDMKAKVADFGLVRLAPDGKVSLQTTLAGTFGYLAPEYAVTGRVTTKADVFSFGVILMELLTGRKALDDTQPEDSIHLVTWFRRMQLKKESFSKMIDSTIELDDETVSSVNTIVELAGHCCAREPYQRPEMGHAVNVLSSLVEMWKPTDGDLEEACGIDLDMTLPQALKKWQAFEDSSRFDAGPSSYAPSMNNTQTSIPTRPNGFADTFTSTDGR